jgi:drug/metabolite transporter (DMT)-like permease
MPIINKTSFNAFLFNSLAIITVTIWGTTYISTKLLLNNGMTPSEIFISRFILAYVGIWFFSYKKLFANNIHDEFLLLITGLTGGSLYFLAENTALSYTLASNVSLILCTAPILTMIINYLIHRKEKIHFKFIIGSVVAFTGVAFVIYNGKFILKLNPIGDFLTICAALMWALYSIVIKNLNGKYPPFFITRKVFFYGILTILPVFIFQPFKTELSTILKPEVFLNLFFLGFVASMLCYMMWNASAKKLGIIKITTYIYFSPVITMIASYFIINEKITFTAIIGCILILLGVYTAERGLEIRKIRFYKNN